jgi:hypothetical protein
MKYPLYRIAIPLILIVSMAQGAEQDLITPQIKAQAEKVSEKLPLVIAKDGITTPQWAAMPFSQRFALVTFATQSSGNNKDLTGDQISAINKLFNAQTTAFLQSLPKQTSDRILQNLAPFVESKQNFLSKTGDSRTYFQSIPNLREVKGIIGATTAVVTAQELPVELHKKIVDFVNALSGKEETTNFPAEIKASRALLGDYACLMTVQTERFFIEAKFQKELKVLADEIELDKRKLIEKQNQEKTQSKPSSKLNNSIPTDINGQIGIADDLREAVVLNESCEYPDDVDFVSNIKKANALLINHIEKNPTTPLGPEIAYRIASNFRLLRGNKEEYKGDSVKLINDMETKYQTLAFDLSKNQYSKWSDPPIENPELVFDNLKKLTALKYGKSNIIYCPVNELLSHFSDSYVKDKQGRDRIVLTYRPRSVFRNSKELQEATEQFKIRQLEQLIIDRTKQLILPPRSTEFLSKVMQEFRGEPAYYAARLKLSVIRNGYIDGAKYKGIP